MTTISAGALKRMLHLPANVVAGVPCVEKDPVKGAGWALLKNGPDLTAAQKARWSVWRTPTRPYGRRTSSRNASG